MYLLMCDMQNEKFYNILTNLIPEEHKTLMERLQRDESCE